jgi:hypothetical protein
MCRRFSIDCDGYDSESHRNSSIYSLFIADLAAVHRWSARCSSLEGAFN